MDYKKCKVGDRIIFNKKYKKSDISDKYYTLDGARGFVEEYMIGKIATITKAETCWYYVDGREFHGYDRALFSKIGEVEI